MGIWAGACALCGAAPSYALLMIARMVVGVGEASFVAMAAPFIGGCVPWVIVCDCILHLKSKRRLDEAPGKDLRDSVEPNHA